MFDSAPDIRIRLGTSGWKLRPLFLDPAVRIVSEALHPLLRGVFVVRLIIGEPVPPPVLHFVDVWCGLDVGLETRA